MAMTVSLIGLLLLLFFPCRMSDERAYYLQKVMHAIENLVDYYTKNYHDLNVDGFFGLRVLEGHLDLLLQEYDVGRHRNITSDFASRLRNLKNITTATCEQAVEFVKHDDAEYFQRLRFVVGRPWKFLKPHRELNHDLRWDPEMYITDKSKKLDENTSDMCMGELMGSNPQSNGQECQISDHCLTTMTNKGLSGYGITHQLLWSMLAEVKGCTSILDQLMQGKGHGSVEKHRDEFCVNNFHEMTEFLTGHLKGTIVPKYQDLFLEQQFICPSLGFYEFLSYDYLEQILAWQKPGGCYGIMPKPPEGAAKILKAVHGLEDYDYEDNFKHKDKQPIHKPRSLNPAVQKHAEHVNAVQNLNQDQNLNLKQIQEKPVILVPKPVALTQNPIVLKGNIQNNSYKHNKPINLLNRFGKTNITGALRNIQFEAGAETKGVQSQVRQNSDVVIQKGHGLVGKFLTDQSNVIAVNRNRVNSAGIVDNSLPDTQSNRKVDMLVQDRHDQMQFSKSGRNNPSLSNFPNQVPLQREKKNSSDPHNVRYQGLSQKYFKNRGQNINSDNKSGRRLFGLPSRANIPSKRVGRQLLAEKAMKGGCLAHKTAVAAGALSMYLQYLVEPGPLQQHLQNLNPNRFLMSVEVTKKIMSSHHDTNLREPNNALVYDNDGDIMKPGHKNAGGAEVAMNNNILAEQLHVSNDNDEEENYYAQEVDQNDNQAGKRDELYKAKPHRLVQFDNGNGLNMDTRVRHEESVDNYPDDEYKDDKEEDGDYNEENAVKGRPFEDVRIQVGRVVPKADERDYTYYEDNKNHQDNYNHEELEMKKKSVEEEQPVMKQEPKDLEKDSMLELDTPKYYQFTAHSHSPTIMFMMVSASMAALVFIMYRFIRSRRIHIRYHPRSLIRL